MQKILISIFALGISFLGNAQELNNWQIGINVNPFHFSRINNDYLPDKRQNIFNGFNIGTTLEKNWNEHWGLKIAFDYSLNKQKYSNFLFGNNVNLHNVSMDFEYFKFPFSIQYSNSIRDNLFFCISQGIQTSLLSDYKTITDNKFDKSINTDGNMVYYIYESNTYSQVFKYEIYEEQTYGLVGSVGIKSFLSKRFSYSASFRYEYDLTTSETDLAFFSENHNTKNFRIGLDFGLQFHFSLSGCKTCDLQKH